MGIFKKKLGFVFKAIATGSLSVLISACDGWAVMYGVPFRASVTAQNASGDPIPQIKVSYRQWATSTTEPSDWIELGRTDANGMICHDLGQSPDNTLKLRLEDTDGPDNSGSFSAAEVVVDEQAEIVTLDPLP